ncbi:hypothetical protein Q9966_000828 [Columba livia]|nr:hypothetical protein Q9966_000828 [Columba livia]
MSSFPELYFNVDNGYLEGLVRGFKAGVLRQGDYVNLVQCESLEVGLTGDLHTIWNQWCACGGMGSVWSSA